MKIFKQGDRVQIKYRNFSSTGIIISNGSFSSPSGPRRYHVEKTKELTVQGTKVKVWLSSEQLSIDTQYYRDEKLKELLNG